ncbi:MAG: hypothetical protein RIF34_07240 [Candidatus Kapaibacterium sp.]
MSKYQVIITFIVSILLTVAMIGGAWWYYQIDNTFFGLIDLEKTKAHYYDVDPTKNFVISGNELIELKGNTDRMYTLEKSYNNLKTKYNSVKNEYDKLMNKSANNGQKIESISSQLTTLAKKEQVLKDSLRLLDGQIRSLKENYDFAKTKLVELNEIVSGNSDSANMERYKEFAKIYNNSKSEEVAQKLENLDAKKSAYILKLMSKKKAGKVIESLNSEYAAKVLIESGKLR